MPQKYLETFHINNQISKCSFPTTFNKFIIYLSKLHLNYNVTKKKHIIVLIVFNNIIKIEIFSVDKSQVLPFYVSFR